MTDILIRRRGAVLDISRGAEALTPQDLALLDARLSYEHRYMNHGQRFAGGPVVEVEKKEMYTQQDGRVQTGFGFLPTVTELFSRHQQQCRYIDITPTRLRPDCFEPCWDNLRGRIEFRAYQEDCVKALVASENGLIVAPTGFGKSTLMEAICHLYPKAKINIVVKYADVAKKFARVLSQSIPHLGIIGGGKAPLYGERVHVVVAASLHHVDPDVDILLADEVHALMTPKIAPILATKYTMSRNFGFTATPKGRMDGAHAMLEMFFGRPIFTLTYPQAVAAGLVVPIKVRWLMVDTRDNPAQGKSGVRKMQIGIWRNAARNHAIAMDARQYDANTQVLILVDKLEHAIHLKQWLPEYSLCYGNTDEKRIAQYKKQHMLPPGFEPVTPDVREQMRRQFETGELKKVIATDVWSTGVDFASLQVLYRADARASEIVDTQAPGRVSRVDLSTNKQYGEVVDCYDMFDPGFRQKSRTRHSNYAQLGWEQQWPESRRR